MCGFGLKSQQSTLTLWVGLGTRAYEPLNRSAQASSLPSLFCTSAVRPARRLVGSELDGIVDSLRSPGGLQGSVLHRQKPGCHSALARVGPPLSGLVPTPSPATLHSRPYPQPRLFQETGFHSDEAPGALRPAQVYPGVLGSRHITCLSVRSFSSHSNSEALGWVFGDALPASATGGAGQALGRAVVSLSRGCAWLARLEQF